MTLLETMCLWHTGAREAPVGALPGKADLAIVGAGILGLNTAIHAARAGLRVVVFDAGPIGSGASGANGGQVIPGLKHDPDKLIALLGRDRGLRLADFAAGTADAVFDLIRNEGLAVPHNRAGWILAAHTETALATVRSRAEALRVTGAPVDILDEAEVQTLTGARGYHGGMIDRRSGTIQPFVFISELARIANVASVALQPRCRVSAVQRAATGWCVKSSAGQTIAGKVLVATNADADALIPGLARTVLPLHSFQIATAPLQPEMARTILPGGQAVSDTRRIVTYYRKSSDHRFVLGGRGTLGAARRLFPQALGTTHHISLVWPRRDHPGLPAAHS